MSTWLIATIGALYVFATFSLLYEHKYGEALMCFGSVIFTAGLLTKVAGY